MRRRRLPATKCGNRCYTRSPHLMPVRPHPSHALVQRGRASYPALTFPAIAKRSEYGARDFAVIEVNRAIAQHLIVFMSLAGQENYIAWSCGFDRFSDGLLTIGLND